ncbi:MAG: tRNA pseudouridine(55) synthase TruB [Bacteroidota bacterium]|nr:tRNA pseudouridine(55) synthase TruB [Bacteroidota bacterium]MDP3146392.1 tRNA pseudouridine(55) synthase TruB [Bacteroidota bacterium]MDP3555747.1 tRNA pseudouridine(55) synthase TruB [Bacteroidota bacterium]
MNYNFYTGELLLIDKPYTWSSFQAVNKIKHALKNHPSLIVDNVKLKPKVGHAGTLDPLATGLLIVCTGKKTKTINDLMGMEKEYTGTFLLGATTPCYDLEKEVDKTFPTEHITDAAIKQAALSFTGIQQQVPPIFSALMINGKRAYELARAGEEVEMRSREIEIKEFEITDVTMPTVSFRIVCSKGTYIRSIARDFGLALNSGAHLTKLCRTRIGNFKLEDAVTPQEFSEQMNAS